MDSLQLEYTLSSGLTTSQALPIPGLGGSPAQWNTRFQILNTRNSAKIIYEKVDTLIIIYHYSFLKPGTVPGSQ